MVLVGIDCKMQIYLANQKSFSSTFASTVFSTGEHGGLYQTNRSEIMYVKKQNKINKQKKTELIFQELFVCS